MASRICDRLMSLLLDQGQFFRFVHQGQFVNEFVNVAVEDAG